MDRSMKVTIEKHDILKHAKVKTARVALEEPCSFPSQ